MDLFGPKSLVINFESGGEDSGKADTDSTMVGGRGD